MHCHWIQGSDKQQPNIQAPHMGAYLDTHLQGSSYIDHAKFETWMAGNYPVILNIKLIMNTSYMYMYVYLILTFLKSCQHVT